ncbi:amidohydrolase family protein [Macroventuria anomochaeta]|uniref:Amidohydrolase family protein n=1 Tax=Macroventuria anomochaeta TaxID=301207 RepID=A0ACB6S9E0_9PLEO|nr:amidohydrolase family protein [Macroventuria anomochaeta]KAF2629844.1 amidohydrolase family protein [Macroventuria anomochaeta]
MTVIAGATDNATVLPRHAWDSHIHIIDPERFPMDPDRDYTPKAATVANANSFLKKTGVFHPVVVLPSVYGTNNSVLLDALKAFNGSARGVCVVDPDTIANATLDQFHAAGVRGVRVNFGNEGTNEEIVEAVWKNAKIAALNNWNLQLWLPIRAFAALHDIIPKLGVRVVTDHYGHALVGSRTGNMSDTIDPYTIAGFPEMIDLVQRKLLFVKISAPYQNSKLTPLYDDMRVVADTIMANGPDMVVYGSDWPHTASKEGNAAVGGRLFPQDFRKIDDAGIIAQTVEWAGSKQQVQRLFVDNPRRLWQWYANETIS